MNSIIISLVNLTIVQYALRQRLLINQIIRAMQL
ncbi:Uncharacterised protein [Segatella copri]|nr:Uncharacterised protein [Segatella copri]